MVTLAVWQPSLEYDMMDKDSFTRVKSWVKELRKTGTKNIVMTTAGKKSDMDRLQKVDLQDSESYAESIEAHQFLTSAKANTGIEETFIDIARCLLEKRKSENLESASTVTHRKNLLVIDDPPKPPPASRCCS